MTADVISVATAVPLSSGFLGLPIMETVRSEDNACTPSRTIW